MRTYAHLWPTDEERMLTTIEDAYDVDQQDL